MIIWLGGLAVIFESPVTISVYTAGWGNIIIITNLIQSGIQIIPMVLYMFLWPYRICRINLYEYIIQEIRKYLLSLAIRLEVEYIVKYSNTILNTSYQLYLR